MKAVIAVLALVAAASAGVIAPATTLIRTPSLDSAVIQSDRLGGNFAYSSVEGHAYAAVSPVVQNVVQPVGVSYQATPVLTPFTYPVVNTHIVPQAPLLTQAQLVPQAPLLTQAQLIPQAPLLTQGPLLIAPGTGPVIAPVHPGVIAPGVIPIAEPVKEGEAPAAEGEVAAAEPAEIQPAEPVEIAPAEDSQSDDAVAVDSA